MLVLRYVIQKIQHPTDFGPIVILRGKQGVEGGTHRERKKWHRLFLNKATKHINTTYVLQ